MAIDQLVVELKGDVSDLRAKFSSVDATLRQFQSQVTSEMAKVDQSFKKVSAGASSLMSSLKLGLAGFATLQFGKEILEQADNFQVLQQRIKTATKETGDYIQVSQQLYQISQKTGASLESTVATFQNIARGAKEIKASNRDILSFVETVQQLGAIGGTSADALNSALTQMGQALASGKLQGDELKSILENMPALARALADGLGVSVGKLREMGTAGELTSEKVFGAILSQTAKVRKEFEELPPTLGRAMGALLGSMTNLLGRVDERLEITKNIAEGALLIANKINQAVGIRTTDITKDIRETSQAVRDLQEQLDTLNESRKQARGGETLSGGNIGATGQIDRQIGTLTNKLREQQQALRDLQLEYRKTQVEGVTAWQEISSVTEIATTDLLGMSGALTEHANRMRAAITATDELSKAQRNASDSLKQSIADLQIELTVLQRSRELKLSEAEALRQVQIAQDAAASGSEGLAQGKAALATQIDKIKNAYDAEKKAVEDNARKQKEAAAERKRVADAANQLNNNLREQIGVLQKQDVILTQVLEGTLSWQQAQVELVAVQKASKGQDDQLADAVAELTQKNKESTDTIQEQIRMYKILTEAIEDAKEKQQNILRPMQEQMRLNEALSRIIRDGIASRRDTAAIEHDIAVERERARLVTQGYTGDQLALANAFVTSGEAAQQTADDFDTYKESLEGGIDVSGLLRDSIRGLAQGTLDIGNFLKQQGQALAVDFAQGFLLGKRGTLDKGFQLNINSLVGGPNGGIIGSLFSQGGAASAAQFADGFINNFGQGFGNAASAATDANSVVWSQAGASGAADFQAGFAGGLAGNAIGMGIGSMLGLKGGGIGGSIGGLVGGIGGGILGSAFGPIGTAVGSAIGAAVGNLFGSFIEALFEHTPTKGTQIRKGIKKFLKEIEVSFADEIDTGQYFFEETKKLANKMFGGDGGEEFLAASKQILNDKIGPELAKQMQALGTFLTADQAADLGKSVEQTGTTFSNMLLDNLGLNPEVITSALDEIIQKAGISFADIVSKLNDLVRNADISMEFFTDVIDGAVDLFFKDLPDAINVSKIAAKSFAEDGTLDLKKFEAELKSAQSQYEAFANSIAGAISKSIAEGMSASETKDAFLDMLKDALRQSVIASFLEEKIPELLGELDFSDPLTLGSEAVQQLADKIGVASDELYTMLETLGLLPEGFDAATNSAEGLRNQIREIDQQLEQIAQRRIQIQLDLQSRMVAIGALQPLDYVNSQIGVLEQKAKAITATASGVASLSELDNDQLNQLYDVNNQIADLTVQRYQEEVRAIETARDTQIQAIQQEGEAQARAISASFDRQRADVESIINGLERQKDAIRAAFDARRDALNDEKQAIQAASQTRLEGLRAELQTVQEFARLATQLDDQIRSLVTGAESPLARPDQMSFLQEQAATLRTQIAGAPRQEQAALINELSGVLQQILGLDVFQQPSGDFRELFDSTVRELEALRTSSAAIGQEEAQVQLDILTEQQNATAQLELIDQQIENLRIEEESALNAIDAQIESQRATLEQISLNEQRALAENAQQVEDRIKEASALAEANIAVLRQRTVEELQALAQQNDDIAREQQATLNEQRDLLEQQLIEMVGEAEAAAMLSDTNLALLITLGDVEIALSRLTEVMAGIIPAATGFDGRVTRPTLFLAGEKEAEYVSISPHLKPSGETSVFSPSISVSMQGGSGVEADAQRLARALSQAMLHEWRNGQMGKEIRGSIERKR